MPRVLTRYTDLAGWIWRDALKRYRGIALFIVFAGGLGLVCEVAAYGVLYTYARALETDRLIEWAETLIPVRESFEVLLIAALTTFVCFVASAACTYLAAQKTIGLWQQYELFCIKRIAVLAGRLPHPASPRASELVSRSYIKELEKDTRYCGRFLQLALNGVLPLGRLVVSAVILLVIDWLFTMIVFGLVGITQFYLHRINVANVAATRAYETHRAAAKGGQQTLLNHLWKNVATVEFDDHLVTTTYDDGAYRQSQKAYLARWMAKEKTTLAVNLLGAVAMLAILLVAGIGFLSGQWLWSILLVYVAALRYFLGSLMQISNMATTASRYYSHLKRYFIFIDDARASQVEAIVAEECRPVALNLPSLSGDAQRVTLAPGQAMLLVHPDDVDRGLLRVLYEKTATEPDVPQTPYWIVGDGEFRGGTLRDFARVPRDVSPDDLQEILDRLEDGTAASPFDPVEPLTEETFAALPPKTVQHWRLAAALLSNRPVIILPRKPAADQLEWDVPCLQHRYPDRVFLEVVKKIPKEALTEDTLVLFSDGSNLRAYGTGAYVNMHPEVWDPYLEVLERRKAAATDYDDLDEEDD